MNVLIGQSAQAPNIVGSFYSCADRDKYGNFARDFASGVFTASQSGQDGDDTGYDFQTARVRFNASNENASVDNLGNNIYTDNGELRPLNYTYRIWKRIN